MTLTGNLEIFPIEEVLRLLARSRKTGCLRVDSAAQQGRLFIAGGALTFATTATDEEVRRQIINAGLVTNDDFRRVDLSGATLSEVLAPDVSASSLTDFVREQIVESLFRVRKAGGGQFDFLVDVAPRYPTGQSFDPEVAIAESDRRAVEWSDIETVVPSMTVPYRLARELPDDNPVTLQANTWRFLAAVEAGASVDELADRLGLSKFRAAKETAHLARNNLLEEVSVVSGTYHPPMAEPVAVEDKSWFTSPAPVAVEPEPSYLSPAAVTPEPEPAVPSGWEPVAAESETQLPTGWEPAAAKAEALVDDDKDDRSWFTQVAPEPVVDTTPDIPEKVSGWWTDATAGSSQPAPAPAGGEEDVEADRFLESVFSQLNEPVTPTEPAEAEEDPNFGLGLLRRRRMGAAARDITGQ
jgi:Domain of unknown function (DUF4388)